MKNKNVFLFTAFILLLIFFVTKKNNSPVNIQPTGPNVNPAEPQSVHTEQVAPDQTNPSRSQDQADSSPNTSTPEPPARVITEEDRAHSAKAQSEFQNSYGVTFQAIPDFVFKYRTEENGKLGILNGVSVDSKVNMDVFAYNGPIARERIEEYVLKDTESTKDSWEKVSPPPFLKDNGFVAEEMHQAEFGKTTVNVLFVKNKNKDVSYLIVLEGTDQFYSEKDPQIAKMLESLKALP